MGGDDADRERLRVLACGSVDDGKSTLIGRILLDCGLVPDDQIEALRRDSARFGSSGEELDPALLLDGLQDEREQGITVDVAYRYISIGRALIVADAPGHEQYTRNMATAASTADIAVMLVDARNGLSEQTRRHSVICSLLGVRHVVLAVNKMDLVDHDRAVFHRIAEAYRDFAAALRFTAVAAIPVSARQGDNVAARSARMPWYEGPTLVEHLRATEAGAPARSAALRFPVQWINRPTPDFRGLSGTVATGMVQVGDKVVAARSGRGSEVAEIVTFDGPRASAEAGEAVTLVLADDLDVARGDLLFAPGQPPDIADRFTAHLVWTGEEPLLAGRSYLLKIGANTVPATVTAIRHRIDPGTQAHIPVSTLTLNGIGLCEVSTHEPIAFDAYDESRPTGGFILVDRSDYGTVGVGMIVEALQRGGDVHRQLLTIGKASRAALKRQRPFVLWFTGLSGAGKSTIADLVEQGLYKLGYHTILLDGDNVRHGLNQDLGFSDADRVENVRRIGEVAKLMTEAGLIVLCSFISPFRAERQLARGLVEADEFLEVFVDTPLDECRRRDPKGLYAKVAAGALRNFTGIDSPYEAPLAPEVHLLTAGRSAEAMAEEVMAELARRGLVER
jgi:bifunctional enzyme CysN/CysC